MSNLAGMSTTTQFNQIEKAGVRLSRIESVPVAPLFFNLFPASKVLNSLVKRDSSRVEIIFQKRYSQYSKGVVLFHIRFTYPSCLISSSTVGSLFNIQFYSYSPQVTVCLTTRSLIFDIAREISLLLRGFLFGNRAVEKCYSNLPSPQFGGSL